MRKGLTRAMLGLTSGLISALLLVLSCPLSISANSAQTHWHGVDSTGAVVIGESCPIEVTKEVLTFDISEFPDNYYREMEEYLTYTGRVTAEYTFYNPTDLTVTATLAFPFGTQPAYANLYDDEKQAHLTFVDTQKYDITINGEAIDKEIRYTLKPDGAQFKLSEDLPRLSDTYVADAFYSPTMTVTKYTYIVGGENKEGPIDKDTYRAANVAFDWDGGDGKSKIYFPEQSGFHTQKDGDGRLSVWADNGDIFSVYVIGQPLSTPLIMKCYQDGGVEDKEEIDGIVSLTNTEAMTLEDLALENWSEEIGVSKVDWYNAVVAAFHEGGKGNPAYNYIYPDFNGLHMSADRFVNSLMRWYQYEITIEPKSSITNTVTAPIYPEINGSYEPAIYTYTYLLSPASTWASFGELEVVINTPFFITENSLTGFTRTDSGYGMKGAGLPEKELVFSLSTSENPTRPVTAYTFLGIGVIGGILGLFLLAVWIVVCVVVLTVVLSKRKRRASHGDHTAGSNE